MQSSAGRRSDLDYSGAHGRVKASLADSPLDAALTRSCAPFAGGNCRSDCLVLAGRPCISNARLDSRRAVKPSPYRARWSASRRSSGSSETGFPGPRIEHGFDCQNAFQFARAVASWTKVSIIATISPSGAQSRAGEMWPGGRLPAWLPPPSQVAARMPDTRPTSALCRRSPDQFRRVHYLFSSLFRLHESPACRKATARRPLAVPPW
jgi:hypothetical protein